MLLHSLLSPAPRLPPVPSLPLPYSSSSFCFQIALRTRCPSLLLRADARRPPGGSIRCSSISQVHSYGTVDFERRPPLKWSSLYRRIAIAEKDGLRPGAVLERWEAGERLLSKWELCRVAKELRKFRRFRLALEVYDWMAARGDRFTFSSSDMAIQLDLIAKVRGISLAEELFSELHDTLKDKRTYGALLNVYSQAKRKAKAEDIIVQMKNKGYATDPLPFNVMMTLYMNIGEHHKVVEIINEMKEMNVTLDIYSYNIWITNCGMMQNVEEMERVVGLMTSDRNINANWTTYTTLASMYIRLGNFEKAQSCLKDAEVRMTGRDRTPFHYLIGLYGNIGKKEEVYRIWYWYKATFPSILNWGYQTMLSSLVRLEDGHGAEMIYEEWISNTSNFDPKICNILLGWYARQGFVAKGKSALDCLIAKGGKPKPVTWEILADGYIKEKQVADALSCLQQAASYEGVSKWRPKTTTIGNLMTLIKEQSNVENYGILVDILRSRGCLEEEEYKSLITIYAMTTAQE